MVKLNQQVKTKARRSYLLLLVLLFSSLHIHAEEIRIAINDVDNSPYMVGSGSALSSPPGIAVELANTVAADIGVTLSWQRLPSKRLLLDLKEGRIDAILMLSYSEERARDYAYPLNKAGQLDDSRRIGYLSYALYRQKGSAVQWDGKQFLNLTGPVGANTGYSVVDMLKQLGATVDEAKETTQNFGKLALGRVQLVAAQEVMGDYLLSERRFPSAEKLPVLLSGKSYFTVFSKAFAARKPELMERFWQRLSGIRDAKTRTLLPAYLD
ncbi:substrate-binding periplasmic protein [Leeia sp.]|uniref:substrate-binding periplasmic protein n=1 Tax=Leeia sp. TaxID=2884678 RepID=UPI0035ADF8AF